MFGVSLNQGQVEHVQKAKADFKQMPVSKEVQDILAQHGGPAAANIGELQSYMSQLQVEDKAKYNQLLDAIHPGLRNQGFDNTPPSVIDNLPR